jgi:hypothetical protein
MSDYPNISKEVPAWRAVKEPAFTATDEGYVRIKAWFLTGLAQFVRAVVREMGREGTVYYFGGPEKPLPKVCHWQADPVDGGWDTGCGEKHEFTVDGPLENNHKYCPYCGGILSPHYESPEEAAKEFDDMIEEARQVERPAPDPALAERLARDAADELAVGKELHAEVFKRILLPFFQDAVRRARRKE